MSEYETFDIEAWQQRMRQPVETEEERLARKALQKKARELSMSPEALSWLTTLDAKLTTQTNVIDLLAGVIDEQNVKLARMEERLEALEHPKPTIWRAGQ